MSSAICWRPKPQETLYLNGACILSGTNGDLKTVFDNLTGKAFVGNPVGHEAYLCSMASMLGVSEWSGTLVYKGHGHVKTHSFEHNTPMNGFGLSANDGAIDIRLNVS